MWIIFTIASAVILASKKIQEKRLVWTIGPALGWMFRLISSTFAIILWCIFSRDITGLSNPNMLLILGSLLFLYPIQVHFYYRAIHLLPISTLGMLAGIVPLTSLIWSYLYIWSSISSLGILAIILTVIAIATLSYKNIDSDVSIWSLLYAVGAYVLFGIGNIIDKTALSYMSAIPYTTLTQIIGTISIFTYSYFILKNTQYRSFGKNIGTIVLVGISMSISAFLISQAFSLSPNPGYVGALQNMHILFTALYGVFVLKEKVTPRKVFVFICMLVALIWFAFA